jgi:predicted small secreted protein
LEIKMKNFSVISLVVAGAILIAGCGNKESGAKHDLRPPDPAGTYKVPTTKAEKIAAIQKAHISDEQKKQAIDKVNAGP